MKSIKTKLILFSALLVVSITALIGVIAISAGKKALKEEAGYSLQLLAAESAKLTQSRISTMISTLTVISKEAGLINMGWEADTGVLLGELEKTEFLDIGYILPNGYTYFTDGTVRLMSDKVYVKDALDGKAGVSDVVISRVTRKPEIEAAVPIRKDGTVVAALIARMEADYLSGITEDIGYGEEGYAFIMNSSGTIIAHPDVQKVTHRYNPVQEGEDKAYQRILDEKAGTTTIRMAGGAVYAGFAPVGDTDWSFVVTAKEEEIMSAIPHMLSRIIAAMIIISIVSLGLVFLMAIRLTGPLAALTKHSKKIGELDIRENVAEAYLNQQDEIGTLSGAFQSLTVSLRDIITEITRSSHLVSDTAMSLSASSRQSSLASEEISKTVEDIARGAQNQAKNTEDGMSQAEVLETRIEANHQCMGELNAATDQVLQLVKAGLEGIGRLSKLTGESDLATRNACDRMLTMKQSSAQISSASKIITDMARQTNLIALNATIEAARAGDAGLGFAVVAREIQVMAEQSAESAKNIDKILKGLIMDIEQAVESMNHILVTSKDQQKGVSDTVQRYQNISEAMEASETAVQKLNRSEKDMESANGEIRLMLQSMSAIAQQNAAGTEQAASAVEEQSAAVQDIAEICDKLKELSEGLRVTVNQFCV
jgi:methyl-accepting chemotaxis protein